jgi:hypothetical protein
MQHHRFLAIAFATLALIAVPTAAQFLDVAGNRLVPGIGEDDPPGTSLLQYKLSQRPSGLAAAGDNFYVLVNPNIYQFDRKNGTLLKTISITGAPSGWFPFGLGVDTARNGFIIGDAGLYMILLTDMNGKVLASAAHSSNRHVGAAFDSNRDGYWATSWNNNLLTLYDAKNLTKQIKTINLGSAGATRAAGTAFSPENDVVYTSSRNTKRGYAFDAATGNLLYSWPLVHTGTNNGQGAAWWDRWQCAVVGDYETFNVDFTDSGYPRVGATETAKIGQALPIKWIATNSANKQFQAAASFTERTAGIVFGPRYVPLVVDPLFILSVTNPAVFSNFAGKLDGNGTGIGAVTIPNIPLLSGIPFSIAYVTVDGGSPFGIFQISGPWKVTMTK